jgi:multidrug resistance efflux pump
MKAFRFRTLVLLLAVAGVLVGLSGAAGVFRQPLALFGGGQPAPDRPGLQGVECLGRVDVEGGLLELAPVRSGRVVAVNVREGEAVTAGAVLLRLDEQPAQLLVQQARAAQQAAQSQVNLAEEAVRMHPSRVASQEALARAAGSRVSAAREEMNRKERLFDRGLIGTEEEAAARHEVKTLESLAEAEEKQVEGLRGENPHLRVQQARAELARQEALLAEALYALEQCVVRAPTAGRVLRLRCSAGEVVSPQLAVIVFAPAVPLIVRAEVEQEMIHRVEVGQLAVVRDEMNPKRSCTGRVVRVSDWYSDSPTIPRRMARFTDIPTVECVIALDPDHPPLRIGQRMTVLLEGSADRNKARPPGESD